MKIKDLPSNVWLYADDTLKVMKDKGETQEYKSYRLLFHSIMDFSAICTAYTLDGDRICYGDGSATRILIDSDKKLESFNDGFKIIGGIR